ncbi:MAG: uracil-DNA glycosylase family protein [Pseudomonadota bacterium]
MSALANDRSHRIDALVRDIHGCRICIAMPDGAALPHEPRPVLRVSATARIIICGQAPGVRVHASGKPFTDPSGDRLRQWMGVNEDEFYNTSRVAIVPMGFCFPGLDAKGGDLPPRRECARAWRQSLFDALPPAQLILLVGFYAQKWHLGTRCKARLTETVANWRAYLDGTTQYIPMPHPSWRNNAWLKRNPWFAQEVLPYLQRRVDEILRQRDINNNHTL